MDILLVSLDTQQAAPGKLSTLHWAQSGVYRHNVIKCATFSDWVNLGILIPENKGKTQGSRIVPLYLYFLHVTLSKQTRVLNKSLLFKFLIKYSKQQASGVLWWQLFQKRLQGSFWRSGCVLGRRKSSVSNVCKDMYYELSKSTCLAPKLISQDLPKSGRVSGAWVE